VVKDEETPLRFRCNLCGKKSSLSQALPGRENHARRIPPSTKARMVADHILGMSYTEISREYRVSRGTVIRAVKSFRKERYIYLWRIRWYNRREKWKERGEFLMWELNEGRLRQGFGIPGADLRLGKHNFIRAWREYYPEDERFVGHSFDELKTMLVLKPGDYVLLRTPLTFVLGRRRGFILLEVVSGYDFEPVEAYDFGHMVRVRKLGEFYVSFESLDEIREEYNRDAQWIYEILFSPLRSIRRWPIWVVERNFRSLYRRVERLARA